GAHRRHRARVTVRLAFSPTRTKRAAARDAMSASRIAVLAPSTGAAVLMLVAVVFGANHIAARFAFDHGASVALAVVVRSAFTALVLLALLRGQPGTWRLTPGERRYL